MATNINKQTAPGFWSTTGLVLTETAIDTGNGNETGSGSDILLLARNTHATNAYTFTITSQPDPVYGRSGNVNAVSLAAGELRLFRLTGPGWADANGKINFTAQNAAVKVSLVQL